jgi:hypothetical protein
MSCKYSVFFLISKFFHNFYIVFVTKSETGRFQTIFLSAENAMEQFSDSALLFLDSIGNPYELNREHQFYWPNRKYIN